MALYAVNLLVLAPALLSLGWQAAMVDEAGSQPAHTSALPEPLFVARPNEMEFTGRLLVRLRTESVGGETGGAFSGGKRAKAMMEERVVSYIPELRQYIVAVPPSMDENSYGRQLLATGQVEFVCPDWFVFAVGGQSTPDDPDFPQQWHLGKIDALRAWDISTGQAAPAIAFVDTGVDLNHPEFAGGLVPGANCYGATLPTDVLAQVDGGVVMDEHGHGTRVAGAAARGNNAIGGTGVGWDLRVMPVRATQPGVQPPAYGASTSALQMGAIWAADHGAKVICISFSGAAEPSAQALGTSLSARGCLLVWAMDNNNVSYAADYSNVLVVMGTDSADNRYAASSFGPLADMAAPAASLWIPTLGGGYGWNTGNSYAAPQVAAAAAMVWAIAPGFTPAQVEKVLFHAADDIGTPGNDSTFGHGRLNLRWALWLAVVRQFTLGLPGENFNADGLRVDDLYDLAKVPRDVDGNGSKNDLDRQWALSYFRSREAARMIEGRP